MHQGKAPDPGSKIICKQGVEVVGNKQMGLSKKKKEKKSNVIFGIETGAFTEYQVHPLYAVPSWFQGKAPLPFPSYKQNIESHIHQGIANPVYALVGGKVVGDRDDYTFQGALYLSAKVRKNKFLFEGIRQYALGKRQQGFLINDYSFVRLYMKLFVRLRRKKYLTANLPACLQGCAADTKGLNFYLS
jgi:hypothetical protein